MPHKDPEKRKAYNRLRAKRYREKYPERVNQYNKNWRERHPEKYQALVAARRAKDPEWSRRARYLQKYGLSLEEREAMFAAQGGLCAICRDAPAEHVDHCHERNEVRALLCGRCNRAIGLMDDDTHRLREAAKYLERFDGVGR